MKKSYTSLDLLRGLSAIAVLVGHVRALMLETYGNLSSSSVFIKCLYFITGFGPAAVMIFFVLSGFFITKSIHNTFISGEFKLSAYYLARFVRLSVVLIPTLMLGYLVDSVGVFYFSDTPFYSGTLDTMQNIRINECLNLKTLVGNLFFIQTLLVPTFGSNGPLWSLAYEWWFYVIAPLFFILFTRAENKIIYLLVLTLILTFLFIFNVKIVVYFPIWLLGSLAYFLHRHFTSLKYVWFNFTASVLLLIVSMTLTRLLLVNIILGDYLIGLSAAYFTFVLVSVNQISKTRFVSFLSGISYSVYAFHFPIAALITSAIGWYGLSPDLNGLGLYAIVLAMVLIVCITLWYIFERNTPLFKRWLIALTGINIA